MENKSKEPKFKVGETAYIMRHSEIKKVIITECYMVGNEINYCCYMSGCKFLVDRISEKYIFMTKMGVIISMLEKTGCVHIEWLNGTDFKITINETEE